MVVMLPLFVYISAFVFNEVRPKHNEFIKGPSMNYQRVGHTASLLNDGRILIVGGKQTQGKGTGKGLNIAEIYNPNTNKFLLTGKLNTTRVSHTATLLNGGFVLLYGGKRGQSIIGYPEIFDNSKDKFRLLGKGTPKQWHTATLLQDNSVLLLGGETWDLKGKNYYHYNQYTSDIAELYYPKTNKFSPIFKLNKPRSGHTATLLKDGTVIIIGGDKEGTVEIYNPLTRKFRLVSKLNIPRAGHTAYLLKNGKIIVIAGDKERTIEIYNPITNKFQLAGKLNETGRSGFATALLDDDSILIVGGTKPHSWGYIDLNSSEIYKPSEQKAYKGPNLKIARSAPSATRLTNGDVLICGGTDIYFRHKSSCELYKK